MTEQPHRKQGRAGRVPLPGSTRKPLATAAASAAVPGRYEIEITVILRRRAPLPDSLEVPISGSELAAKYGADPADIQRAREVLEAAGTSVVEVNPAARRLRVRGLVVDLESLFGTRLTLTESSDPVARGTTPVRARSGGLSVPAELDGIIVAVLGLDDRPQTSTRFRAVPAAAVAVSYTPVQLGQIYNFPADTDGEGQTVAIIELGGGFEQSDLDAYFAGLGLDSPRVTAVGVDGATNAPEHNPNGADGEVLLDIEVVGALAPKADIVVYFGPNTDAGFLDAVIAAAHASPTPAAISISWGQSEDEWTGQARTAMDEAFADAGALGVTVTAAAGDDGSTDRSADGRDHCDFPASSPHALGCGGTSLRANSATGAVNSENVWNNGIGAGATGGGVSDTFGLPSWQANAGVPTSTDGLRGRGVPDVSAVADPQTGYQVRVDGEDFVIGGTSAVSPLWAALTARLVQALGRPLGLLNPRLYGNAAAGRVPPGFRDITQGNNGSYSAGPGWDACTGLGVPHGEALLAALSGNDSAD